MYLFIVLIPVLCNGLYEKLKLAVHIIGGELPRMSVFTLRCFKLKITGTS